MNVDDLYIHDSTLVMKIDIPPCFFSNNEKVHGTKILTLEGGHSTSL